MGKGQPSSYGCALAAHIKVPDARECMRKLSDSGSHLAMVYGDYTRELQALADMPKIEVVHATYRVPHIIVTSHVKSIATEDNTENTEQYLSVFSVHSSVAKG